MLNVETFIKAVNGDIAFGPYRAKGFRPIMSAPVRDIEHARIEATKANQYYRENGRESFSVIGLYCASCDGDGIKRSVKRHKRTGRVLRSSERPCLACMGAQEYLTLEIVA